MTDLLCNLPKHWILFCGCFLALPTFVMRAADLPDPDRFERTTVAANLVQPMEFDVAPDGTIFLIELAGKLKTIDPGTGKQNVVGELQVTTAQENGLIGLALAPDFQQSGWIYLQYSPTDFEGQRVSRFQFRDGQLQLESEQRLLQYQEQRRECCHHAGALEFGPDGCLYIGTGDNTNPFEFSEGYAPIDERPGREPWDAQRTSANSRSHNGKILRIRPEADGTYSIPEGNLFPSDGSQGLPEIYVMGCRNPWRISIDPRTGFLYWGDVGPDAGQDGARGPRGHDEVNQARQAGNFGWPYFMANNQAYRTYDFETKTAGEPFNPLQPINRSVNNTGVTQLPPAQPAWIYYPAAATSKFPEVGSGGRTACAGPIYYADQYSEHPTRMPDYYDRTLFVFEWSRNWIVAVHLNQDSSIERMEPFLPNQKFTRPIQLKFDTNGSLLVLLYGETWGVNQDAELIRLDYVRGNRAPEAKITVDRQDGREPLKINLSAEQSRDRDGDTLVYIWSYAVADDKAVAAYEFDESEAFGIDEKLELEIADPGVYTIHLEVWDSSDAFSRDSVNVIVGNARPQIKFLSPQDGDFFDNSSPLDYSLQIDDFEDGTSDYSAVSNAATDLDELNPSAAGRTMVELVAVGPSGQADDPADAPEGLKLIRQSGCLNCHASHRMLVGPAFVEIANKYREQASAMDKSIERVQVGSTGVWGKVPMLPHAHRTRDEVRKMVEYIYSVKPESAAPTAVGLQNQLNVPNDVHAVRLDASYTDGGRGEIPALTSATSVLLRARKMQTEHALEFTGTKVLDSGKAEGGKFMGAIDHGGHLRFTNIPWNQVGAVRASVASAGAGGQIEIRQESATGPLLGTLTVTVNGNWEEFYQVESKIESPEGRSDVYFVFVNQQHPGGLMNVDWIEFLPRSEFAAQQ